MRSELVRAFIPRAMLVAQVGPKEHARLAITAAREHLDAVEGVR